jgi:sulfur-oxidizing protein SoxZ
MTEPTKIRAVLKGDVADVRILMTHPMETGRREDASGKIVPAHFIERVAVAHNGRTVLTADLSQGVSRNPFLALRVRDARAGDRIGVSWTDNRGARRSDETAVNPS